MDNSSAQHSLYAGARGAVGGHGRSVSWWPGCLVDFKFLSVAEVANIAKSAQTWCSLDPTSLVVQCVDELLLVITSMINVSL